ncbi:unnamed protein product [Rhizophagus irregularis]|uniref:MATA-HMG n=1 Tax=Rhizophagus irregularis TaxID=588596 RepID=A0A1B1EU16_9GLOM|nr:MATA-HMG [Rhizophagus irregularis]PKY47027.1 hypothetical protein RhiirA4_444632 [Rhizophagus irregularis]CAB4412698.1 unnamed protein product [Rhizophagus irregularis]
MTQELDKWATQAYNENKDNMENVLNLLRIAIDNDEMPKAKELLQVNKKTKKGSNPIKRPSNSNIIYTNQLGKFGLLDIIRRFCDDNGINKQKLVPISKKISNILWKELSPVHQKFFEELASEVKKEHEAMYPSYKYKPKRKPNNHDKFKPWDYNESKTKPLDSVDCIPSPMNNMPVSRHEELDDEHQEYREDEELDEQIREVEEEPDDEDIYEEESDDETYEPTDDSLTDSPPKFREPTPPTPLILKNLHHHPSPSTTNNNDDYDN